jgi:hypothetical protein
VDLKDPDTQYAVYTKLGQTDLIPTIDKQHQRALQNQDAFLTWVRTANLQQFLPPPTPKLPPGAPPPPVVPPADPETDPTYPFKLKPWYDPNIHRNELVKWAVSDPMVEVFTEKPQAEYFVARYLSQLDGKIAESQQPPPERMRTSLALQGQDLQDPQVRIAFDRAQQLPPPGPPSGAEGSPAEGAAKALQNSNQNSAPVGNTAQPAMPAVGVH